MKKIVSIIILAAAVFSCTKEPAQSQKNQSEIQNTPEEVTAPANQVSFAVRVEGAIETMATISSNTNFTWEESDRAAVFSHEGEKVELVPSSISGGSATFTGTLSSDTDYIETDAIVVFPAARLTGTSASPTVTFPSTYTSASATQGPTLAAKVTAGRNLMFKYLAGTIKLTISDVSSVMSSFYVNTRNVGNTEDVVCTGTFTVDFSGDTPALTNATSTGNNVTIANTSTGSTTFCIPLPTTGDQTVWMDIKTKDYNNAEDNLATKSVTLASGNAVTRNMFVDMPALAISPSVYMVSDMTSWSDGDKVEMTKEGASASITLNALNGKHWRPIVVYPSGYWVFYGFTGSDSNETSGTFTNISGVSSGKMSALVGSSNSNYTLTFNYLTGAYSSSSNSTTGNFYSGTTSFEYPQEMTKLTQSVACDVRKWKGELFAYYNNYASSKGNYGNVGDDNYYLWVYDFSANSMIPLYLTGSDKGALSVSIRGTFNGWGGEGELALTNISGTPAWYIDVNWASTTQFKFLKNAAWQDASTATNTNITSYCPSTSVEGGNIQVAEGKYRIIYCESGTWVILTRTIGD